MKYRIELIGQLFPWSRDNKPFVGLALILVQIR